MTKLEKIKAVIEKGFTYDPQSGKVLNSKGREIISVSGVLKYPVIRFRNNGKTISLKVHQFAWYCVYNETVEFIDHINRNTNDNRIENLRSVTRVQNQWNLGERKGYVWRERSKTFEVKMSVNGKRIYLGGFKTEEEAANKYKEAKKEMTIKIFNNN